MQKCTRNHARTPYGAAEMEDLKELGTTFCALTCRINQVIGPLEVDLGDLQGF